MLLSKQECRSDLKKRRDALSKKEHQTASDAACRHLAAALAPESRVALYYPIGSELSPLPLLTLKTCRWALPAVRGDTLVFLPWDGAPESLYPKAFGILEPDSGKPLKPDVLIVPLLGFDSNGHRLGYGKGFYDRAAQTLPHAQRIGLAHSVQEVPRLPTDPWDVPMHAVATEKGLRRWG
jgi:5-formyltetrahydrofolate cyclo-ligase